MFALQLSHVEDPTTAAFNVALEERLAAMPPLRTLSAHDLQERRRRGSGLAEVTESELTTDRSIVGAAGPFPIRVLVPETVHGVYLHLHGGGWVAGSARLQDSFLEATRVHVRRGRGQCRLPAGARAPVPFGP